MLIFLGIFLIGIVSSVEVSYCCEKTKTATDGSGGAWCIETAKENCATGQNGITGALFRKAPTSCSSTSYCKLGTCINGQEGTCFPNVPQIRCQDDGGYWVNKPKDEVPQCKLGCCLIGNQAAFVTQTRCKTLSSLKGLETIFKNNVQSELQCIALAFPSEKGACVYEEDYERKCKSMTKEECQEAELNQNYLDVEFHVGYLCSAPKLGTNCGPSKKTTCVENEDEVYFLDTCGNLANIYDSLKIDNVEYWTYIKDKDESCNPNDDNTNSKTCGNCDTFLSSTCMNYERGKKPNYGDFICGSLDCKNSDFTTKYNRDPKHGEQWCVTNGNGGGKVIVGGVEGITFLPGTEQFKLSCFDGEITVDNSGPWRSQICVQGETNEIKTAAFKTNRWQGPEGCAFQDNKEDCENEDKRDCEWVGGPRGFSILKNEKGESLAKGKDGDKIDASCVPKYPPAFNFWETGTDAGTENKAIGECSKASTTCIMKYEKKIGGKTKCVENCGCDDLSWGKDMNKICTALGDCGSSVNYIGKQGYHNGEALKYE